MVITILLVDHHLLLRECLRAMIDRQSDMQVVAEVEDGRTAMQLAAQTHPDIALVDVTLPGLNGIDLTRRLREITPVTHVIALSMHSERRFINEMFRAGASAYLLKDISFATLVQVIREITDDRAAFTPLLTGALTRDHYELTGASHASVFSKLSAREREILQLIAEGETARTIADKLCISISTVETHRKHICAKLGLHSTAELTLYAIREGLSPL